MHTCDRLPVHRAIARFSCALEWYSSIITCVGLLAALCIPPFAASAEEPARIRVSRSATVLAEDGTAVQTLHVELAINNDSAARQLAQQKQAYAEGLEQVELTEGYTLKPDGRQLPVQPDAVRTQLMPETPNLPAYTDRKQMIAVFPDVAGGDTLVMTWRRRIPQPMFPGQFALTAVFLRTAPWDDAEVTISTPADKPLLTEEHGPVRQETDEGSRHLYHWRYSASAIPEDRAVLSPLDRAPRLFASTFPDWQTFSRAYHALVAPKMRVTPRIQALADKMTEGARDPREQVKKLYEWVSSHVRWVGLYIGDGTFIPHPADDVLQQGYGDCKDQAVLLIALLRAKGIEAEPVLISHPATR
jgi:hypothetical protein